MTKTQHLVRIDANLLVLLVVGLVDPDIIRKHKRLRRYTDADFDLLLELLGNARLCVLPNIATEAHNLLTQHEDPEKTLLAEALRQLILRSSIENYVPNKVAVSHGLFLRLGVSDVALLLTGSPCLLTDDLDLYLAAKSENQEAINFTHSRVSAGIIPQPK